MIKVFLVIFIFVTLLMLLPVKVFAPDKDINVPSKFVSDIHVTIKPDFSEDPIVGASAKLK